MGWMDGWMDGCLLPTAKKATMHACGHASMSQTVSERPVPGPHPIRFRCVGSLCVHS
ncbi:hypothetical protein BO78DRAFT_400947 [Aspergillus sclerotiicarbonarius CBS 121057]|uniref:Uncharacterized protein n=1 Tax=Aspergillus sclerotiicarbonarius (strain CBS 121057 / IBT 28362) TaxID=1448318 RepID=A0A319DVW6_ASPSB|nr:hypothetical protein BO78DRAFT_400947 [Aspergillus sclerotiicarbonarius CBS 121057]